VKEYHGEGGDGSEAKFRRMRALVRARQIPQAVRGEAASWVHG
jgi:hypothetical protein